MTIRKMAEAYAEATKGIRQTRKEAYARGAEEMLDRISREMKSCHGVQNMLAKSILGMPLPAYDIDAFRKEVEG